MLIGNKRELCWKIKSELAVKTLVIYMSLTKFSLLFPFPHTVVNVRICKGKGRFTMFFCLGGIVCIKLSENGSPVKLHHISDIPNFPLDSDIENYFFKYSICSVYIVKSLIFSLWIHLYNFPAKTYCYFSVADSSSLAFYREPVLPTRFLLLYILLIVAVSFWYQDGFQRKDVMRVILRSL